MRNILCLFFLGLLLVGCKEKKGKEEIIISVAASLTSVMEELANKYSGETGVQVHINTGGSGSLRKQMEEGAPIDFIFLASKDDIYKLKEKKLVGKVDDLLENEIVLLGNNKIKNLGDIKGRIAMGDPNFVPAGRYGKEFFINSKIWDKISRNLVLTKDVRSSLSYVIRGEVDFAVIYASDIRGIKDKEVYKIEKSLYSPIIYSLGVGNNSVLGENFYNYLKDNVEIFEKYGFKVK